MCQSNKGGDITSGGGFGNKNARPAYQATAVESYLSKISPFPGFNRLGRAYPDVSALSFNYTGVYGGVVDYQSGSWYDITT
jgi:tripeptidyl-peptidase-1